MNGKTFLDRFRNFGSFRKILKSYDFILTLIIFLFILILRPIYISKIDLNFLVTASTIAISLAAFIIAAFSILVSLSNKEFIIFLKKINVYDKILFLFEWNIYTTVLVSVFGLYITYFENNLWLYRIFIFSFMYMIFSILNLVSFITYYGQRKGEFEELRRIKRR